MKPDIASLIPHAPLLAGLPGIGIGFLVNILRKVEFPAGRLLFREGDAGSRFYVSLNGKTGLIDEQEKHFRKSR